MLEPTTAREVAGILKSAGESKRRLVAGGHFSKKLMGGPTDFGSTAILTTTRLNRVLKYEPRDLTISVQAGMPFRMLEELLAKNGQMIPLDPIYSEHCTVGGVVAANTSGPRRRQYGTARDFVIGMQFAMMNGRLVETGGMVVKNVAGLDMGKLMIGSFGTLAVITSVNFKVVPLPPAERTFAIPFATCAGAMAARDKLIRGPLQPTAIDLVNPAMAAEEKLLDWTLLLRFGGNEALMERCEREVVALGDARTGSSGFWEVIQNLTPRFLAKYRDAAVVRISCALDRVGAVMETLDVPAIARAGTGLVYAYFVRSAAAAAWLSQASLKDQTSRLKAVMEHAPESARNQYDLWPMPGTDFEIMEKVKRMFDPDLLLNRGRLYRRI